MAFLRNLLWVDCVAAAAAGTGVLALGDWLSRLHALPYQLLMFTGVVNLVYGSYSFYLARRLTRPMSLIKLLVFANASWVLVCLGLAARFHDQASAFGLAHLVGEALFVGVLAGLEWNQRERLATPA